MNEIFVTADLHYKHKNIVKGVSYWNNVNATRDFDTVEEMDEAIVESINNTVGKQDTLYILGDIAFGNVDCLLELMKKIRCENIHCILGNHDKYIEKNVSFTKTIPNGLLGYEFLGKTLVPGNTYTFNVRDLFKSVSTREEVYYKGKLFVLDHYPLEAWKDSFKGSYMIHGHVHGSLDYSDISMFNKRIDVDWGKFKRPISLDEIMEIMKDRKNLEY